jgi:hypothetical protein
MQKVIQEAFLEYKKKVLLSKTAEAFAALKKNNELWQEEIEERQLWDNTLRDEIKKKRKIKISLKLGAQMSAFYFFIEKQLREEEFLCKQIEGIIKFLGESYRCTDLNEGLLKIEQLLVKEVLYEQDY